MSNKDRLLLQLQRRSLQKTEDGRLHAASLVEILCQRQEIDRLQAEIARLKIAAGEVEPRQYDDQMSKATWVDPTVPPEAQPEALMDGRTLAECLDILDGKGPGGDLNHAAHDGYYAAAVERHFGDTLAALRTRTPPADVEAQDAHLIKWLREAAVEAAPHNPDAHLCGIVARRMEELLRTRTQEPEATP